MENGRMDSDSKLPSERSEPNRYIVDLGSKLDKSCFGVNSSITYQNSDDGESSISLGSTPLMENEFSSHNGGTSFENGASYGVVNGDDAGNNHQNQSRKILKNINSSQCSFNPQNLKSNNVENELSSLTLKECTSVEILELTSVHCSNNCNDTHFQKKMANQSTLEESKCALNNSHSKEILSTLAPLSAQDTNSSFNDDVVERVSDDTSEIIYISYESENQMPDIMKLIQKDLSEPYSIYTYRYFIHNWPHLCFLAVSKGKSVGAIVCKLDLHRKIIKRGYIAMLAVDECYRKKGIGSNLVLKAIRVMAGEGADEVVLETEITNQPALRLYENLGFVRDKRLFRYYLNGVDALRLKLWLR